MKAIHTRIHKEKADVFCTSAFFYNQSFSGFAEDEKL